ncbi:MAG: transglutaminase domain-containing protein [Flavisolibacter sp.]
MSRKLLTLLLICILQQSLYAQDKGIDAMAQSIPESNCTSAATLASYIKQNFTTDSDRIRAIYVWITHHVSYDLLRLQAILNNQEPPQQTVDDVLHVRSAVCQGYSDLFVALCDAVGIRAMEVGGYTKTQKKVSPIPHAWAAALLNGEWWLFDPTWGAGYVMDGKFVPSFNNSFFKAQPSSFIADHMPFDPLYQFLDHPITNREFIEGNVDANKSLFNYKDSLQQHLALNSLQQTTAELRRLEAAGVSNNLLMKRQLFLKKKLQSFNSNTAFEEGSKSFNTAVDLYKIYIGHKNTQFTNIGDAALQQMMDSMVHCVSQSRALLSEAVVKTDAQRQAKADNIVSIEKFWNQLNRERQFLNEYFAADAEARKKLFVRR